MTALILTIAIILILIGFVGCVIPVIPGPPIAFGALLLLHFFSDFVFDINFLWKWGIIVFGVTILDFWLQIYGVKKLGGNKKAINGTMIGLLIGLVVPIPFGFVLGPFIGAFIGAYIDERDNIFKALKIAFGSLLGFFGGIIAKIIVCVYMTYEIFNTVYVNI